MGQEVESQENYAGAVPEKSSVAVPPGSAVVTTNAGRNPAGNNNNNSGIPMWQQEKLGAKCCGCCCDYRRAVFILAVITICASGAVLILSATAASLPGIQMNVDDDDVIQYYEDAVMSQIIINAVSVVCAICALIGAHKFNIYLVGLNVLWYIGSFIGSTVITITTIDEVERMVNAGSDGMNTIEVTVIPNIIVNFVVTCLYMYPHIGFIYEVKKGIMSFETYPREEFSCCCAPTDRRA